MEGVRNILFIIGVDLAMKLIGLCAELSRPCTGKFIFSNKRYTVML